MTTPTTIVDAAPPESVRLLSHWIDGRSVPAAPEQTGPVFDPAHSFSRTRLTP